MVQDDGTIMPEENKPEKWAAAKILASRKR